MLVNYSIRELKDSIQLQNMQVRASSDRLPNKPVFFLWRFVKDRVYKTPVRILSELQDRICVAVNNFTPQMLHNTWVEVEYRLVVPVPLMGTMLGFMK